MSMSESKAQTSKAKFLTEMADVTVRVNLIRGYHTERYYRAGIVKRNTVADPPKDYKLTERGKNTVLQMRTRLRSYTNQERVQAGPQKPALYYLHPMIGHDGKPKSKVCFDATFAGKNYRAFTSKGAGSFDSLAKLKTVCEKLIQQTKDAWGKTPVKHVVQPLHLILSATSICRILNELLCPNADVPGKVRFTPALGSITTLDWTSNTLGEGPTVAFRVGDTVLSGGISEPCFWNNKYE